MINETITGSMDKRPIKTFNERYEIGVRKIIGKNLEKETRTDGEEVFVVDDLDILVLDIMNFYEEKISKN